MGGTDLGERRGCRRCREIRKVKDNNEYLVRPSMFILHCKKRWKVGRERERETKNAKIPQFLFPVTNHESRITSHESLRNNIIIPQSLFPGLFLERAREPDALY